MKKNQNKDNNQRNLVLLFGGESSEHEASLKMFEWMYSQMQTEKLDEDLVFSHVVYISRDGKAILLNTDFSKDHSYYSTQDGLVPLIKVFDQIKEKNLFVYSLLQGQNAEDGRVQGTVELLKIDASVGGLLPCTLSQSKYHLNQYIGSNFPFFKIPKTVRLKSVKDFENKLSQLDGQEVVIKPNSLGGSIFAKKLNCSKENFSEIEDLLKKILDYDTSALIQEYVDGQEYACGCIEKDGKTLTLPIMKIETAGGFFGHDEKHKAGMNKEILLNEDAETEILKKIKKECANVFEDLDYQNMCRFDLLVKNGDVYFLEINSFPGLMKKSLLTQMLGKIGYSVVDLVSFCYRNYLRRGQKQTVLKYKID